MKRLELTQHTVRCPLEDCIANVTVRTDPGGYPSCRHLDVTACSLLPSSFAVTPARSGYFSDVAPPLAHLLEVDPTPRHSSKGACTQSCLAVLNAAEPGASESVRCMSGMNDSLELARQTQSRAMMRLLWYHSV